MFKKRVRPAGVRDKGKEPEIEPTEASAVSGGEDEEDDSARTVEELIMLRKLRKAKQGIDLEKLNRGEDRRRKKKDAGGENERHGLQTRKDEDVDECAVFSLKPGGRDADIDRELEGEQERAKRLVRSNNFTQQTNALDVDRHM